MNLQIRRRLCKLTTDGPRVSTAEFRRRVQETKCAVEIVTAKATETPTDREVYDPTGSSGEKSRPRPSSSPLTRRGMTSGKKSAAASMAARIARKNCEWQSDSSSPSRRMRYGPHGIHREGGRGRGRGLGSIRVAEG